MVHDSNEWIASAKELIAFLEEHPDLIPKYGFNVHLFWDGEETKTFAKLALQLGSAEKTQDDFHFSVTKDFGPHKFDIYTQRKNVCEKRVISSEVVEYEIPDPQLVGDLPTVTVTEVIEEVEWVCPPSLHELAQ